jgi:predicted NUDIX family phosphoesterase
MSNYSKIFEWELESGELFSESFANFVNKEKWSLFLRKKGFCERADMIDKMQNEDRNHRILFDIHGFYESDYGDADKDEQNYLLIVEYVLGDAEEKAFITLMYDLDFSK